MVIERYFGRITKRQMNHIFDVVMKDKYNYYIPELRFMDIKRCCQVYNKKLGIIFCEEYDIDSIVRICDDAFNDYVLDDNTYRLTPIVEDDKIIGFDIFYDYDL